MDLGAPHGIRFRFEAGLLRAVLLDVHRKAPLVVSEHLTAEAGARDLVVDESRDGRVRAVLRQRFDLPAPAEWRLKVDAPATETGGGVAFALPDAVSLHVSGSAPCAAVHDGVSVALPAGESELRVTVTSAPVFDVADTVVVCRPDQVREAAVVVSCLPADRFTPVVALQSPPMSEADYLARHAEYTAGRALGDPDETSRLRAGLTPYRSWLRHHELLGELLLKVGVRRAVFLCDPEPEELNAIDPADGGGRLFDGLDAVHLSQSPNLTSAAWQALRDGEPETLDVPPECDFTAALFTSLRLGRPLRVVDGASPPPFDAHNPEGDEAVLVEDTGTADTLVAAAYAHHRGARLVITPPPDLTDVQRIVAEEQERVTAAARAIGDAVKGIGFVEALWRYLSTGDHDPYAAVEAVVTAQVPAEAVAQVGERRLTAFTTGLPYPFVHSGDANWTRKPIGHVVADPTLVVLTELYGTGVERQPGAFSLVFDNGSYRAADVPESTDRVGHFTHAIVLSGADASLEALCDLAEDLPVELVFFNTHGPDDGIVLGGRELPDWSVPHWLSLPHRPIVFNNSCRSWTGLGREFVRVGARGYIGTLWSIPSNLAAGFARTVVRRLTTGEAPAAHAVVNTGTPGGVERSYLYVGTVNGRLDEWRDRSTTDGEAALAECELLAAAARDCEEPLIRVLHREITALRTAAERAGATDTPSYVDVLLDELALTRDDAEAAALVAKAETALAELALPDGEAGRRWALRYELTGYRHEERGEYTAALADFERCVGRGDACRDRAGVLLRMARLLVDRDRPEQARQAALEAHDASLANGSRARLMEAIGVLGELSGDDHATALRYAVEGHDLAVELDDRPRQARFKLEECVRHREAGDLAAAVEAGLHAVELFRAEHDDRAELAAVRELGACHRDLGDLETAQHYATVAVALAERLGVPADLASCHDDLGRVLTARGDHPKALEHYRHAVELLVAKGEWEQGAALLPDLAVGAVRAGDPEALWTTALSGGLICEIASRSTWASVLPLVVDCMKRAIETGPLELTQRGMTDFAHAVTTGNRDDMPFQVGVLADVVVVLLAWLMDRVDHGITGFAKELDRTTGGVLDLAEYISVPFSDRARNPGQGRSRRA
ncbi:tetratricopeptide (TPR) repeat protein [Saccharothrix tamanrassetensis]|uniref:Tetratricopeptide (TPR) repeat protein n=1 Tax=Saccharothrix tamanrassetensis TaxID=1051531 RepID=A0A841C6A5_9PSEU|nr:tetratricopeptide repeat protein [Saccharothrix tamanrassetensis]MBB5954072.1 tetratricopeptide (TPR) repeat protein [Saccharothrix tamanrassetensis]